MDYEQDKIERKEKWMKENAYKSQLLGSGILPMNPDEGFYITVGDINISEDFFEKEYTAIVKAYTKVMDKLEDYYINSQKKET